MVASQNMATAFSGTRESTLEIDMSFPLLSVRVPASTSNCGPGFDTLGLAFDLYNEVSFQRRPDQEIVYRGNDTRFRERELGMIREVAEAFFASTGLEPFGFSFDIRGDVPLARGLGSSVTVRAGILGGLNASADSPLSRNEIVGIVTRLEGHPDNAAAAVLGGFCVARAAPGAETFVDAICFPVPRELVFVVLSPDLEIETAVSRRALPANLPFPQVIKSLNSLAYLVSVFATGDFEKLRGAVIDCVHQPYRLPNIPGAAEAIAAGIEAGAYTGWLSGSGSSVLCVAPESRGGAVASAMGAAFAERGVTFRAHLLHGDNEGLKVTS
jgi:homoserine kinase